MSFWFWTAIGFAALAMVLQVAYRALKERDDALAGVGQRGLVVHGDVHNLSVMLPLGSQGSDEKPT